MLLPQEKGGDPYLIKTSKDITSFEADDVTLCRDLTEVTVSDEHDTPGKLKGTFVKSVIPEDGLFISEDKFWYSTGKTNVKAFRCWFELGAVLDKETDFSSRIYFNLYDELTGIDNIKYGLWSMDNAIYDLQGRKNTNEKLRKGIYIKRGKKVIIK